MFENYTRFEWGVEVGVVTIFVVRLFVPHEFDMMTRCIFKRKQFPEKLDNNVTLYSIYVHRASIQRRVRSNEES